MMIRINLLPIRQVKKQEVGRQILVLMGLVLVGTAVGNFLWYSTVNDGVEAKRKKVTETKARIAELEKVIGEVNNLNKRKKEVEEKLKVLEELRKGRTGPVRLMDALANATPKRVSLVDFDEKNNVVKVIGRALSMEDVGDFMRQLQGIVWTPKGLARVLERKRDATTMRVEVIADGSNDDFGIAEVKPFFSNIDLKRATQVSDAKAITVRVDFEISMGSTYSI
jgi:type IV pilus assembly protein PilN